MNSRNYCFAFYSHPSVCLHRLDPIDLYHVLNWELFLEIN